MKINLVSLLLDQAATLVQKLVMNLDLRQMRWNGGDCSGFTLLFMAAFTDCLGLGIKNKVTTRERLA